MDVKKFRQEKNLSQAQLAKLSGVAQSSICYIENGCRNPSIDTAKKLARALGVDLLTLINS